MDRNRSRSNSGSDSPVKERSTKYEAFVRNLPFQISQNDIEDFFSSCGTIENINVLKDRDGRSKGICFVKFSSRDALDKAIAKSGQDLGGRDVVVQAATPKEDRPSGDRDRKSGGDPNSSSIFVGNLSFNTSENDLRDLFEGCGEVTNVRVAKDQDGRPRGFAHIDFSDNEGASNAIRKSGTDLDGRAIRVDFSNGPKSGGGKSFGGGDRRSGGYGGDRRSGGYGGDRRNGGGYGGGRDRRDSDRGYKGDRNGGGYRRRDDY